VPTWNSSVGFSANTISPPAASALKGGVGRASQRPMHTTITRMAERTTGGCASARKAYRPTNSIAAKIAVRRPNSPVRMTSQKPYAKMPTCTPEIASKWIVPVRKNCCFSW
jgi:hypothetical protein